MNSLKILLTLPTLCAVMVATVPTDAHATQKGCWLYADKNSHGKSLYMEGGQSIGTLAAHQFNDIASSAGASEGFRLEFFEDVNFTGKSRTITSNHGNLDTIYVEKKKLIGKTKTWNDRVSSAKCSDLSKASTETQGCWLYADTYSKGKAIFIAPGASIAELSKDNFEDIASSVRSTDGLRVDVYEHPNFGGKSMSVRSGRHNIDHMYREKKTMFKKGKTWNDTVSSAKCVKG